LSDIRPEKAREKEEIYSMHTDWFAILPQMILAGGGLFIFCFGAFWRNRPGDLLFALALLAAIGAGTAEFFTAPESAAFSGMLYTGIYAKFFSVLFSFITVITLLFMRQYAIPRKLAGDECYALILFTTLGMTLIANAAHWLTFFLGYQLLSLSLYVLIAINKKQTLSGEAGLKYLIMGAVAGAFLAFGIALLYAMTGTLEIQKSLAVNLIPENVTGLLLALSFIMAGIAFKVSLVPFHLWTADVYQGAPAPVTAFLATGAKAAFFAALLRFVLFLPDTVWIYCIPVVWILAMITMVVGNVTAISQTRLKRLLAYSSIAQVGYLFMTLLAAREGGANAILFYLVVYVLMDLGAFGIIGTMSAKEGGTAATAETMAEDRDDLRDYQGLAFVYPIRSGILTVCLLSLAGIPPMAGFLGKFIIFMAVLKSNYLILVIIGIITVIFSVYYYFKVAVSLFMKPQSETAAAPRTNFADNVACAVIFILIILLGLIPSPLFKAIARIVTSVTGPA
jgi:NADH-quinone oxidoreductase subunit N